METDQEPKNDLIDKEVDDTPPVFSSWKGWYSVVIGALLLQIVLYYIITKVLL